MWIQDLEGKQITSGAVGNNEIIFDLAKNDLMSLKWNDEIEDVQIT
jgi:hypothetical protein